MDRRTFLGLIPGLAIAINVDVKAADKIKSEQPSVLEIQRDSRSRFNLRVNDDFIIPMFVQSVREHETVIAGQFKPKKKGSLVILELIDYKERRVSEKYLDEMSWAPGDTIQVDWKFETEFPGRIT